MLPLNHDLLLLSNRTFHRTKEMLGELVFQNTLCLPWQPPQALPCLVIVDLPTRKMARKAHFGYGFFLIIGLLLTLVAIFTPGWRSYKDKDSHEDVLIWALISGQGAPDIGLVSRNCGSGNRQVDVYDCRAYGRFQLPFEKLTLAFMIIALLLELVSLGCFIGLFSPRARLGLPAFSATGLAFVCLFIAIVTYGVRMQYKISYLQSTTYELLANVYLGYSYWIAVIATIFILIASSLSGSLIGPAQSDHLH